MRSQDTLSCDVGLPVSIPHPTTGEKVLDISTLHLKCQPSEIAVPIPSYSWTKDGVSVITNAFFTQATLDEDFIEEGNNSLLFLIFPPPISVSHDRIIVDFTAHNATSFPEGVVIQDLQRFVLNSILGEWSCLVNNSFGNVSASSVVFGKCRGVS